jgi:hypothetical protein
VKNAAFKKRNALFCSSVDLNLRKYLIKGYRFEQYWNLDASESRSEISGKFWNVALAHIVNLLQCSAKPYN